MATMRLKAALKLLLIVSLLKWPDTGAHKQEQVPSMYSRHNVFTYQFILAASKTFKTPTDFDDALVSL